MREEKEGIVSLLLRLLARATNRSSGGKVAGAVGGRMVTESVWFPLWMKPLMAQLEARTGGFMPLTDVIEPGIGKLASRLHKPTLYPQLVVPRGPDGDWGGVARGVLHMMRSLDGMPELRTSGSAQDRQIAQDINTELELIAAAKHRLQSRPTPIENLVQQISDYLNIESIESHKTYQAFRLLRLKMEEDPQAPEAFEIFRRKLPKNTSMAERIFEEVVAENLLSAASKGRAAKAILSGLNLDTSKYFFHQYRFGWGVTEVRSLDYYSRLEALENQFWSLIKPPFAWIEGRFPFVIPDLEGVYQLPNVAVLMRHRATHNPRATWQVGEGTTVSASMDPAGLYAQTQVEIILGGRHSVDILVPPTQTIYANIDCYPKVVHASVEALNQLAYKVRRATGRCDLPDIAPAHFNKIAFKQFDENGNVERDIRSLSFELVTVTAGAPQTDTEARESAVVVDPLSFSEQLIESAKLHVFQTNARRAVIDFAGAFEAFAAESLSTRLDADLTENTKQRFLRLYDQKLPRPLREQIEVLNVGGGDHPQHLPIRRILRMYQQAGVEPRLDEDSLRSAMTVYDYRNDAAHGRPIPSTALSDLIQAIPALEDMWSAFSENELVKSVRGGAEKTC